MADLSGNGIVLYLDCDGYYTNPHAHIVKTSVSYCTIAM